MVKLRDAKTALIYDPLSYLSSIYIEQQNFTPHNSKQDVASESFLSYANELFCSTGCTGKKTQ
jgi:hypothetical protein